jgi:spore germination cell wall hydrolase CwlJ-like protein
MYKKLLKPAALVAIPLVILLTVIVAPTVSVNAVIPLDDTEVYCLTRNAYYEAKGDSQMSQIAVTHVVLNRLNDPKFPKSACEVVYQKNRNERKESVVCQFSWYCDKRMMSRVIDPLSWTESYVAVEKALKIYYQKGVDVTEGSTFYHANYINPGWRHLEKVTSIGSHVYYKVSNNDRPARRNVYEKDVLRTN